MADSGSGIIIADDDVVLRGILRSVLASAGHNVFVAINGPEAIAFARQFVAKLVLLDIGMPKLNGLQTFEAIRTLPGYALVPIVMLTNHTDDRIRMAALKLGANKFITKPFRPDRLLEELAACLNPSPQAQPAARGDGWVPENNPQLNAGRDALRVARNAEHKS